MSTSMAWSQNFCLSCDNANHTAGPYCSETCRLSDMDRSKRPDPHAALYSQSYSSSTSSSSSSWGIGDSKRNSMASIQSGSYSTRSPTMMLAGSYPSSPSTASFLASSTQAPSARSAASSGRHHHSHHHHHHSSQSKRDLASSSSRSSLASVNASSHGLSDQAVAQLRYYMSSFDQSRDYRRKGTLS